MDGSYSVSIVLAQMEPDVQARDNLTATIDTRAMAMTALP